MQWSKVYTEYSRHRVQYTPSTAFTEYCIHCVLHHPKIDCLPLPASLISRQTLLYSILYICTITSYPINRVSAPVAPPSQTYLLHIDRLLVFLQCRLILASKVHLQTRSIVAFDHGLQSASPNSLDHGLQMHLHTRSITAAKFISNLARLRPPSASPNSFNQGFQLHLETRSIVASKCMSKLAQLWPPSASRNSLNHGLRVYPWVHLIVIYRCTSKLGKLECVFRIMKCLFTPGSPKYILSVAEFISIIAVSPNVYL